MGGLRLSEGGKSWRHPPHCRCGGSSACNRAGRDAAAGNQPVHCHRSAGVGRAAPVSGAGTGHLLRNARVLSHRKDSGDCDGRGGSPGRRQSPSSGISRAPFPGWPARSERERSRRRPAGSKGGRQGPVLDHDLRDAVEILLVVRDQSYPERDRMGGNLPVVGAVPTGNTFVCTVSARSPRPPRSSAAVRGQSMGLPGPGNRPARGRQQ